MQTIKRSPCYGGDDDDNTESTDARLSRNRATMRDAGEGSSATGACLICLGRSYETTVRVVQDLRALQVRQRTAA